jgi:ribulose-5-phosphate 4-epimerase/fuculose-1-phosphate aldolase
MPRLRRSPRQRRCDALGRSVGKVNCIILRYHSLMTIGDNVRSAFIRMYYIEQACKTQSAVVTMGEMLAMTAEAFDESRRSCRSCARPAVTGNSNGKACSGCRVRRAAITRVD